MPKKKEVIATLNHLSFTCSVNGIVSRELKDCNIVVYIAIGDGSDLLNISFDCDCGLTHTVQVEV